MGENLPISKKTQWGAMDKELLEKCIHEFHDINNTLANVIAPTQMASLSQALSSQIQRSISLVGMGKETPTLGVFERAAAETDNRPCHRTFAIHRFGYLPLLSPAETARRKIRAEVRSLRARMSISGNRWLGKAESLVHQ